MWKSIYHCEKFESTPYHEASHSQILMQDLLEVVIHTKSDYIIICTLIWIKSFVVADVIRGSHFRVTSTYTETYTGAPNHMSALQRTASRRYKWPKDLMRHIKMHLEVKIKCVLCNYRTHEKRLLLQHKNVHLRVKKFKCRKTL